MRICITGGAGFIGATLTRHLEAAGVDVVVLDDLSTGDARRLEGTRADVRIGSVLDAATVSEALAGVSSVVHLAAVPSVPRSLLDPVRSHEVNASGTLVLLEAARRAGVHVITASSSSVYGRNPILPKSEDMVPMPASPYAVSKLAAESYTLAYRTCFGLSATAFRFFNVFGPLQPPDHDYAAVVPSFVSAALRGEPLVVHGDGQQSRDFTFVGTVVDVLASSIFEKIDHEAPVNLAFGTRSTLNELISVLSSLLGRTLEVEYRPPRVGDVKHSQASPQKLHALFPRVRPVSLEDGLAKTISWTESYLASAVTA